MLDEGMCIVVGETNPSRENLCFFQYANRFCSENKRTISLTQVTANNEYKLKEWNADNKGCRKTSLGPTFGGAINRLLQINRIQADGQSRPCPFAAYGTPEKVIGLVR